MGKKKKRKKVKELEIEIKELYCMDCGTLIDPILAFNIESTKKRLKMPNMLVFCDDCQFKFKNRLRRIWNGFKFLFE